MDIRLIAMDLDGTALQTDRCSFSPRLIAALEEAHNRGIAIAVVTGRQYTMLPPAVQNHPVWENLVVLCNGAQIRKLSTGEWPSSKATLWVKAQHEGALPPPCIVRKDPRVPHTAR